MPYDTIKYHVSEQLKLSLIWHIIKHVALKKNYLKIYNTQVLKGIYFFSLSFLFQKSEVDFGTSSRVLSQYPNPMREV